MVDEGVKPEEDSPELDPSWQGLSGVTSDQAQRVAIQYANRHKSVHGDLLAEHGFVWGVVGTKEFQDRYEVALSFIPEGLAGQPGIQILTVDKTGKVLNRQVLSEPVLRKRSRRRPLWVALAGLVVAVAAAGIAFGTGLLSESDSPIPKNATREQAVGSSLVVEVLPDRPAYLASEGSKITLNMPFGSVSQPVRLFYRAKSPEQVPGFPEGFVASDKIFELTIMGSQGGVPGGFSLMRPAVLTIALNDSDLELAGGIDSNVVIQHHSGVEGTWSPIPTTVDFDKSTARARLDSFSLFALTIKAPEQEPVVGPTPTRTPTPGPLLSPTPASAPVETPTPTRVPVATATPTPAPTATATPSPTPTSTPIPLVGSRTATPSPIPTPVPQSDLLVESITWTPETPSIGDTVIFTVTVRNMGEADSPAPKVRFYRDDVLYSTVADLLEEIPGGDTIELEFSWTALAGFQTFMATVDEDDEIFESDETNNDLSIEYDATSLADLLVADIAWEPANPSVGDTVTFTVEIKNRGEGNALGSLVRYYKDDDAFSYDTDEVDGIIADGTAKETFSWIADSGVHTFTAKADDNQEVVESNESNNELSVDYDATDLADLVVESIEWSPAFPSLFDTVTFTVTVKNQGPGVSFASTVQYYKNGEGFATTTESIPPLPSGGTATGTFEWTAEYGSHTFSARIDLDEEVIESDEINNETPVVYNATSLADLVIDSITWNPPLPAVGATVTFFVGIKNQGRGNATTSVVFFFRDSFDYPFGSEEVSAIPAGGTALETFTWIEDDSAHTFRAVADFEDDVLESGETNNEKTINYEITHLADLFLESIAWEPLNPSVGQQVTFTVTIGNQGLGGAEASVIRYYLDGADVEHDSDPVIPLPPDGTTTESFTWVMEDGSHTFIARADDDNQVVESDETNNSLTAFINP